MTIDLSQLRFGRIAEFDERSRSYALPVAASIPNRVHHRVYGRALDQRQSSSCTGHAMAHALNATPLHKPHTRLANHDLALRLYSRATFLDPFPGDWTYPAPDGQPADRNGGTGTDEGSSGLAVNKAAKERGLTTGYLWGFGYDHALEALPDGPIMIGIEWLAGMMQPDPNGVIRATGRSLGGHELLWTGYDLTTGLAELFNSWGPKWGKAGRCYLPLTELRDLINHGGDCVRPTRATA